MTMCQYLLNGSDTAKMVIEEYLSASIRKEKNCDHYWNGFSKPRQERE